MVCPTSAVTRYTCYLQSPPSPVAAYDISPYRPNVSLSLRAPQLFGYSLQSKSDFVRSNHISRSLTFNSFYYRHGQLKNWLIPVTVDAPQFLAFRKSKRVDEKFSQSLTGAIANPQRAGRRAGLGLSVGLPKRLNRVFGEGGAGLRVSGYRRIMFSGRSQWSDAAKSDIYQQSKFPSLNMDQSYRFDINGTIGTKISVKVSEDSKQDIPLANRLIIRYKGDEDDVLKSIEAGNTNLSLPRTKFVGYSSNIRGLFGIKTEAQIGKLRLVAIASQEQGSSEQVSITPTGEESAVNTRDYNYVKARIFDLGDSAAFSAGDSVISLFAYEVVNTLNTDHWLPAKLMVDPAHPEMYGDENMDLTSSSQSGVKLIDQATYTFYSFPDRNQHYVVFSGSRLKTVGVYMKVLHSDGSISYVGNISEDPLLLKLLYRKNPSPQNHTWGLMWRNCYPIPRGVTADDIEIRIFKGSSGNEGTSSSFDYQELEGRTQTYLEILGLDQYNERDDKLADGKFDERLEVFRPEWGLIIFPHRRPFAADTSYVDANGKVTDTLVEKTPDIYDYTSGTDQGQATLYYIQLVTRARSSTIRLGRANIIEGSERVTVNGRVMQRGKDYNIKYDFGQLTLISDEAMDPNADINIQFEYAPYLALQKKTLLGMRAEYVYNKDLDLGATMLYKSDKAQERKPRVGQETSKSVIYDLDGSWRTRTNFLTKLADALPLVETEAPSSFRIEGEIAQSHPNPNVEGQAYVDDFEAAQEQLSLGTRRTTWKHASKPFVLQAGFNKGKLLWHAPKDPRNVTEVWDVDPRQGEGSIFTMRMIFRPQSDSGGDPSWAGVMRGFAGRIDAERVQHLEIRARINDGARGKLHIDVGSISEDVDNDGNADTEDNIFRNGTLDEEEDVGLDGLADVFEPGYDKDTLPDPNDDDWFFLGDGTCPLPDNQCDKVNWEDESIRYEWLNGTEGNRDDPGWIGIPDEETLNRMRGFNNTNAYFSYVIDFDDIERFRVEGSNKYDWWTYRIPIKDPLVTDTAREGDIEPMWNEVSHVRVWFESEPFQEVYDTVEVAAWYFVQSNWRDTVTCNGEPDCGTNFEVASISEQDRTFSPPPGVEPYKDPNYNVVEAQRGLLLKFENFAPEDTCLAVKKLITVDKYSGYRRLEMYVYGEDVAAIQNGQVMFVLRVGSNADNFYEQRRIIKPGWHERNHINFDFNDVTGLKDAALRSRSRQEYFSIDTTSADGIYRVRGNPNINDVKYFAAGVINRSEAAGITDPSQQVIDGEVWLDELRVTDVRRDVGTAARVSCGGTVADLMSYSFSYDYKDAYFRGLSSPTRGGSSNNLGSGSNSTRIGYNGRLSLHMFLPKSWGANIPLSYSHSKSVTTPLLRTSSDIVLPEDVRKEEQSISESNSITISESFNRQGRNPLFNLLLNRLKTNLNYSRGTQTSVNRPYGFTESYKVGSSFNLGVKKPPTLPLFFWTKSLPILKRTSGSRLGLYPSNWTVNGTYNRRLSINDDINYNRLSTLKRDFSGRMSISYNIFDNMDASLDLRTTRDLSNPDEVSVSFSNFRLGIETQFNQSFSMGYNPNLVSFLGTGFSYGANYSDNYSRSSKSRLSRMTRKWSVSGKFEHLKFLKPESWIKSGAGDGKGSGRRRKGTEGAESKPGRPFYDPPLMVLRFLTGWINPITYNYSESYNASVPGMLQRPGWKYRFGIERETTVPTVSEGRAVSSGEDQSYGLSSGFRVLGGISTTVKFSRSISRDIVKQGSRYEHVSTSWPDLQIRIGKFKKLPLIKSVVNKFIDVFSPRTGYGRQTKEEYDIDGGFLRSRSVSIKHSPLMALNFKLVRSLSLSGTYTLSRDNAEKYSPATGTFQSETRGERRAISVSTKYSFSAPSGFSVPILGKIRFRSTMSITVDVKKSKSLNETKRAGEGWVISTDKTDFSVNTNIAYTFSQQIKGGLRAGWQDSADNYRNRNNHVRQLEIWAEIRF